MVVRLFGADMRQPTAGSRNRLGPILSDLIQEDLPEIQRHSRSTARNNEQEAFASAHRDYRDSALFPGPHPQHPVSAAGRNFLESACCCCSPSAAPARERAG